MRKKHVFFQTQFISDGETYKGLLLGKIKFIDATRGPWCAREKHFPKVENLPLLTEDFMCNCTSGIHVISILLQIKNNCLNMEGTLYERTTANKTSILSERVTTCKT